MEERVEQRIASRLEKRLDATLDVMTDTEAMEDLRLAAEESGDETLPYGEVRRDLGLA